MFCLKHTHKLTENLLTRRTAATETAMRQNTVRVLVSVNLMTLFYS